MLNWLIRHRWVYLAAIVGAIVAKNMDGHPSLQGAGHLFFIVVGIQVVWRLARGAVRFVRRVWRRRGLLGAVLMAGGVDDGDPGERRARTERQT